MVSQSEPVRWVLKKQPVIDILSFFVNKGRAFIISYRVDSVSNNDSIYLFLDNPSGSGFDYDCLLFLRSAGEADIDISFGATQNDGTTVTAHNLKSGSSRTFSGTAETSTTGDAGTRPSHGTTFIESFIPGTRQSAKVGPGTIGEISYTIDENSNKLMEIVNRSGGGAKLAINCVVYEVDGTYKDA